MRTHFKECGICGAPGAHSTRDCPAYRINEMQEATSTPQVAIDRIVKPLVDNVAVIVAAERLRKAWRC